MPTDPCKSFSTRLSAFLDGELPAKEAENLRRHLSGCPACTARLQEMKDADLALAGLPAPEPSPFFNARVAAAARALNEYHGPFRRFLRLTVPAMALAVTLILVNLFSFAVNLSAMEPLHRKAIIEKVVSCMRDPSTLINPAALAKLCGDCGVYMCSCMKECSMDSGSKCPICASGHTEEK